MPSRKAGVAGSGATIALALISLCPSITHSDGFSIGNPCSVASGGVAAVGTVVSTELQDLKRLGIVSWVSLNVSDCIVGECPDTLKFVSQSARWSDGNQQHSAFLVGSPHLEVGDRVLIGLWKPPDGLSSDPRDSAYRVLWAYYFTGSPSDTAQ